MNADLLGKGYTIYLDNWFSSPDLYLQLHGRRTNVVGTARQNRHDMPKDLRTLKLKKGEVISRSCDKGLLALVWRDKKDVRMLSTAHTAEMVDSGKRNRKGDAVIKPKCVIDYNRGMKGVDLADQLASSHRSVRKSIKWYKKVFLYLLDVTLVNSFLLYKQLGGSETFNSFRLMLAKEILEMRTPNLPDYRNRVRQARLPSSGRLSGKHFPAQIPITGSRAVMYKRCYVCLRNRVRKTTKIMCDKCEIPLCAIPCFKIYHS